MKNTAMQNKMHMDEVLSLSRSFLEKEGLSFLSSPAYTVFPGFCDVHVHLREPGFSYKETVVTGTASAARGG